MKFRLLPVLFVFVLGAWAAADVPNISSDSSAALHKKYSIPLLFAPTDNGVDLPDQVLDYEVTEREAVVGGIDLDIDSMSLRIERSDDDSAVYLLKFSWPNALVRDGTLSILKDMGRSILFKKEITEKQMSEWVSGSRGPGKSDVAVADQSHTEIPIPYREISAWNPMTPIKFCIVKHFGRLMESACSREYNLVTGPKGLIVQDAKQDVTPEVRVNGKNAVLKGSVPVKPNRPVALKVTINGGAEFYIQTRPKASTFTDIIQESADKVVLKGGGQPPVSDQLQMHDDTWEVSFDPKQPSLMFVGEGAIPLRQEFKFTKPLPQEHDRIYLAKNLRSSSYSSKVPLHGLAPENEKVSSTEASAHMLNNREFTWTFAAPKKGESNQSHIVETAPGSKTFTGNYQMQRGFPFELSGGLTAAVTSATQPLILGELQTEAWLDQFLSWESPTFSVQRWGLTGEYLVTALSAVDSSGNTVTFNGWDVDLRYRFSPGVWNKDATLGVSLGYQAPNYDGVTSSMAGIGLFWSQPMPGIFEKIFDYVKFLRYPKILSAAVRYYPLTIAANTSLGVNLIVNVDGKLFVRDRFFFKGGIEYRSYDFTSIGVYELQTTMIFTTVGIGLDF